jgi:hypothetical protein
MQYMGRTNAINRASTIRWHTKGNAMDNEMKDPKTLSVPAAGKLYFGLCRAGSYAAATRGEIPTLRIGRRLRVPIRALEKMLDEAKPEERST